MFERKYRASIPDFGHHIVAFGRLPCGGMLPVAYLHMTDAGDGLFLSGGACTDGERVRTLPQEAQQALADSGGLMQACLLYAMERFASCDAVAAFCGDARALSVTPTVGLEPTDIKHLLVRWMRPLTASRQRLLLSRARSAMPF